MQILARSALASFGYTVGVTGNRTTSSETVNGTSRTYNWNYDYLYRLTSEGIQNIGTVNYQFDSVGNRTNRTSNVSVIPPQTNSFTANDWLASDTYDNNGNTTASTGSTYQYDVMNHLTNATIGATTIQIVYDGDGNRVSKKVGSTTTYYLVDDRNPSGYAQVVEEWTSTGTPALSRVYNYGLALISQRIPGVSTNYFGTDGHGCTRFLTGLNGGITDTYTYDAYGLLIASASTGTTPNNYLYCCQQFDSDLQMYYNRARYYKPDSGRFWTMDSYEGNSSDPLSLHKYLYCHGNPIMGFDPSGHEDINSLQISMAIRGTLFAMNIAGAVHNAKQFANDMVTVYQGVSNNDPWEATVGAAGAVIHGGLAALNLMGMKSFISSMRPPPNEGLAVMSGGTASMWQFAITHPATGKWIFEEFLPVIGTGLGYFANSSMGHEVEWEHRDSGGRIKARGTEESGSDVENPGNLNFPQQQQTHTEWKVLSELTGVKQGDIVTMRGWLPPCNPGNNGCFATMKAFATRNQCTILYSIEDGTTWEILPK